MQLINLIPESQHNDPEIVEKITLTDDQENALTGFIAFLTDPMQQYFTIEGFPGTGKSTLIATLMDRLSGYVRTAKLIDPSYRELTVQLTATTNKAAEAFSEITGMDVITIHSFLGLRVNTDYKTGKTSLIPRSRDPMCDYLLFIDEGSYADDELLRLIGEQTLRCKIVIIGDRTQLSAVMSTNTPAFHKGYPGVMLTKVMRQMVNGVPQENPISDLAALFRDTVLTGDWHAFKPDGIYVRHLDSAAFEQEVMDEFTRSDWKFKDSKVLAWTNHRVTAFNNAINNHVSGTVEFQVGDYAVNNKFVQANKNKIKTDAMVHITCIEDDQEEYGVPGKYYTLDYMNRIFMPNERTAKTAAIAKAKARVDLHAVMIMTEKWIDLRPMYAQTVNKSQGSTYDKVYIDIGDIARCNNGNTIARMMNVAVSRARIQVNLTGDF